MKVASISYNIAPKFIKRDPMGLRYSDKKKKARDQEILFASTPNFLPSCSGPLPLFLKISEQFSYPP